MKSRAWVSLPHRQSDRKTQRTLGAARGFPDSVQLPRNVRPLLPLPFRLSVLSKAHVSEWPGTRPFCVQCLDSRSASSTRKRVKRFPSCGPAGQPGRAAQMPAHAEDSITQDTAGASRSVGFPWSPVPRRGWSCRTGCLLHAEPVSAALKHQAQGTPSVARRLLANPFVLCPKGRL